jgi:hypothetical protein
MISEVEQDLEWSRQRLALKRQAEEAEIARYREWAEGLERKMRAKRLAQTAEAARKAAAQTAPPPPEPPARRPTSGRDWRVIDAPAAWHEELEQRTRLVFDRVFHGIPWPEAWIVRWGTFDEDPLQPENVTLGMTVYGSKLIVVDERRVRDDNFWEVMLHELSHVLHPKGGHGPAFQRTLKMAMDYLRGWRETLPAIPARHAPAERPAHQTPPTPWVSPWARFRPGGLHPGLEYRG